MVQRILVGMSRSGAWSNLPADDCRVGCNCAEKLYHAVATSPAHVDFARKLAARGAVLLKNEAVGPDSDSQPVLPIAAGKKIALLGGACGWKPDVHHEMKSWTEASYYTIGGTSRVLSPETVTLAEALKQSNADVEFSNNDFVTSARKAMAGADVAVVCAGATSTESVDRTHLRLDQDAFVGQVILMGKQLKVPVVVVVYTPGAVVLPWSHILSFEQEVSKAAAMKEPASSMASHRGLVISTESGFYGAIPRLLTYSPDKIWTFSAPFVVRDLTVCNAVSNVLPHLVALLYALILMIILCFTAFPDGEIGEGKACDAGNVQMCQLEETMKNAKVEFRFLVAFVLAGFVAMTVGTWHSRRTTYAALCGNVRNLIVQLATFLPVDKSNQQLMQERRKLGRWVILAFELALQKARGKMDALETREFLESTKTLLPAEWNAMVAGDRHTTVIAWIQQKCVALQKDGVLLAQALPKISEDISSLRGKANDLMGCLEQDKPYAYSSLVGLLVNINLLIMCTWKGVEWSIWCRSFGDKLFEQPKFWLDVLVLVVWNMSYRALYDLTTTLHNPFGGDATGLLLMFPSGQATGWGAADILLGRARPSAKLPVTIPLSEEDALPPCKQEKCEYKEKLFGGWHMYDGRSVAFPFGFGLTYTKFEYSPGDMSDVSESASRTLSVEVRNVGDAAGSDIVQLYLSGLGLWDLFLEGPQCRGCSALEDADAAVAEVESFGDARLREAFKLFPDQGPCFGGGVDHCFKKIFFARATYGALQSIAARSGVQGWPTSMPFLAVPTQGATLMLLTVQLPKEALPPQAFFLGPREFEEAGAEGYRLQEQLDSGLLVHMWSRLVFADPAAEATAGEGQVSGLRSQGSKILKDTDGRRLSMTTAEAIARLTEQNMLQSTSDLWVGIPRGDAQRVRAQSSDCGEWAMYKAKQERLYGGVGLGIAVLGASGNTIPEPVDHDELEGRLCVLKGYPSTIPEIAQDPPTQLRRFLRTRELQPGEAQTLIFKLGARDEMIWDPSMRSWTMVYGEFTVGIGHSSRELRLCGAFNNERGVVKTDVVPLTPCSTRLYLPSADVA
eukprot:s1366_g1.t2